MINAFFTWNFQNNRNINHYAIIFFLVFILKKKSWSLTQIQSFMLQLLPGNQIPKWIWKMRYHQEGQAQNSNIRRGNLMTSINSPYIFMETNVSNSKLLHFLSTQKILTRKFDVQSCFVMEIIDKYLFTKMLESHSFREEKMYL